MKKDGDGRGRRRANGALSPQSVLLLRFRQLRMERFASFGSNEPTLGAATRCSRRIARSPSPTRDQASADAWSMSTFPPIALAN